MNEKEKVRLCAEFLVRCLDNGWEKKDLDGLEKIWWDFDGWRYSKSDERREFHFGSQGE